MFCRDYRYRNRFVRGRKPKVGSADWLYEVVTVVVIIVCALMVAGC